MNLFKIDIKIGGTSTVHIILKAVFSIKKEDSYAL